MLKLEPPQEPCVGRRECVWMLGLKFLACKVEGRGVMAILRLWRTNQNICVSSANNLNFSDFISLEVVRMCVRMSAMSIFTALFFCLSLSLMAASVDSDQNLEMQRLCGPWFAKLPDLNEDQKTLEVRFVRQDGTICGAFWDVFKLVEHDRVWRLAGSGVQKLLMHNQPINEWDMNQELKKMRDLLFEHHSSIRVLGNLTMITIRDMREIIEQIANPWEVALTASALNDCTPGMLSISVVGGPGCLVRPPVTVPVQEHTEGQTDNQEALRDFLFCQEEELRCLEERIGRLEMFAARRVRNAPSAPD